jgi:hypothetical protein
MVSGMGRLAALHLGVARQHGEPRLRRIADRADGRARVSEQQPCALFIVPEHLGYSVRPAAEELSRQTRLKCLNWRACLEPGHAPGERDPEHCRPRLRVRYFDRADRLDVRSDPLLDRLSGGGALGHGFGGSGLIGSLTWEP